MTSKDLDIEDKGRDVVQAVKELCHETDKLSAINDDSGTDKDEVQGVLTVIFKAIFAAFKH